MKGFLENIYCGSKVEYFNELTDCLKANKKRFIITVNPESVITGIRDSKMANILLNKNYSFVADGIAIVKKCRKYGFNVKERITGIDIASFLLEELNRQKKSLFLFGSTEEVIQDMAKMINQKYKNIQLLGYSNGYVKDKDIIFQSIIDLKPDVCMVAIGIPLQEYLINKHYTDCQKGIFIGVGGSFDVLSGHKQRAPKIFIKLNIEWLYRILSEPKRIGRFVKNNVVFFFKR